MISNSDGNEHGLPLSASQVAGEIAVVAVTCELDMLTVPAFEQMLAQEARAGHRALVVDLSRCDFLGSSGLAALVEAHDRGRETGAPLALAGLSRTLSRGIEITGLDDLFDTYPSVEAAVAAFPGT